MFDVIPYWMWVVSLIALALMCGAVLSGDPPKLPVALRARRNTHGPRKVR
ncbi:hypothetical protein [Paraburkholderia sp. C35]|nr:hypothetical protein [Paraburkholderia sp. C35]